MKHGPASHPEARTAERIGIQAKAVSHFKAAETLLTQSRRGRRDAEELSTEKT